MKRQNLGKLPTITCEKCFHKQSPETTNDAVLASLMTLNGYLLAILNDLEIQYGTIRSREISAVVCVLGGGTILGMLGMGFWVLCVVVPWTLGSWVLWRSADSLFERFINNLLDNPEVEEAEKTNLEGSENQEEEL